MFADLGHFSYTAIQVMLPFSLLPFFLLKIYPYDVCFLVVFCLPDWCLTTHFLTDCFHLSGLSSTYIGIYGSSCVLVNASPQHP